MMGDTTAQFAPEETLAGGDVVRQKARDLRAGIAEYQKTANNFISQMCQIEDLVEINPVKWQPMQEILEKENISEKQLQGLFSVYMQPDLASEGEVDDATDCFAKLQSLYQGELGVIYNNHEYTQGN